MDTIISPFLIIVKLFTEDSVQTKHYLAFAEDESAALAAWKNAAEKSEGPELENYESFNVKMVHTLPAGQVIPEKSLDGIVFSL